MPHGIGRCSSSERLCTPATSTVPSNMINYPCSSWSEARVGCPLSPTVGPDLRGILETRAPQNAQLQAVSVPGGATESCCSPSRLPLSFFAGFFYGHERKVLHRCDKKGPEENTGHPALEQGTHVSLLNWWYQEIVQNVLCFLLPAPHT